MEKVNFNDSDQFFITHHPYSNDDEVQRVAHNPQLNHGFTRMAFNNYFRN